jgi:hypothetical protein
MGMVTLVMFYFVAIFLTIVRNLSPAKSGAQLIFFAPGLVRFALHFLNDFSKMLQGVGTIIAIASVAKLKQVRPHLN